MSGGLALAGSTTLLVGTLAFSSGPIGWILFGVGCAASATSIGVSVSTLVKNEEEKLLSD
jgi:uncharacterized protein YaaW (UPF0174 family)